MTPAVQHDFRVRLGDRERVAEHTIACRLEKPPDFEFKPGQFVEITLLNSPETDAEGNSRAFSIASSPRDDFLLVATRLRESAFKRVLSHAPQGTQVKIDGPFGDLRLHNDTSRTAVMLCGGIGITPFRSIIVNATENKLSHRILLFYSNRRPEDAPFLEELQALEKQNLRFKLIGCMTEMESHGAAGMASGERSTARCSRSIWAGSRQLFTTSPDRLASSLECARCSRTLG